jgi:hypothetical protein
LPCAANVAALYLYPSEQHAKTYCQGTRVATFSAVSKYHNKHIMHI